MALGYVVVECCEPAVDRRLNVLELAHFVVESFNQTGVIGVLIVEVIEDEVDGRTHLYILLLESEVVEQVGIDFHRDLLVETHWNL